jgi:hypothetical protein
MKDGHPLLYKFCMTYEPSRQTYTTGANFRPVEGTSRRTKLCLPRWQDASTAAVAMARANELLLPQIDGSFKQPEEIKLQILAEFPPRPRGRARKQAEQVLVELPPRPRGRARKQAEQVLVDFPVQRQKRAKCNRSEAAFAANAKVADQAELELAGLLDRQPLHLQQKLEENNSPSPLLLSSAYEQFRLQNITRNNGVLLSLGFPTY